MPSQYRIPNGREQELEEIYYTLIEQLETFLELLLTVCRPLWVQTFLLSIVVIVTFRNQKQDCVCKLGRVCFL